VSHGCWHDREGEELIAVLRMKENNVHNLMRRGAINNLELSKKRKKSVELSRSFEAAKFHIIGITIWRPQHGSRLCRQ
jgi:hypothetical protein